MAPRPFQRHSTISSRREESPERMRGRSLAPRERARREGSAERSSPHPGEPLGGAPAGRRSRATSERRISRNRCRTCSSRRRARGIEACTCARRGLRRSWDRRARAAARNSRPEHSSRPQEVRREATKRSSTTSARASARPAPRQASTRGRRASAGRRRGWCREWGAPGRGRLPPSRGRPPRACRRTRLTPRRQPGVPRRASMTSLPFLRHFLSTYPTALCLRLLPAKALFPAQVIDS